MPHERRDTTETSENDRNKFPKTLPLIQAITRMELWKSRQGASNSEMIVQMMGSSATTKTRCQGTTEITMDNNESEDDKNHVSNNDESHDVSH